MLLGLRNVPGDDVRFAYVFVSAFVLRVKLQGLFVLRERSIQVTRVAIGESEPVVRVGIEAIPGQRGLEFSDRPRPILAFTALTPAS